MDVSQQYAMSSAVVRRHLRVCSATDVVHHNLCVTADEMMDERHADYVAAQQERCK